MRKVKLAVLIVVGLTLLTILIFFIVGLLKPKVAGIYIETNPSASVYINQELVGRTSYEATLKPQEVIVKLIPDSFQTPLAPYETKVNLTVGVKTVIRRDFGELDETSAGEIISFEKIGKDKTSLSVVTVPESAQLVIDGRERAFTPHKTSVIVPGEHVLTISANGFTDRMVEVKTHQGYQLTAVVKLAKKPEIEASVTSIIPEEQTEKKKEERKIKIEIMETGVGFLRVRSEPSTLGEEVTRVKPGESYLLIEEDEKTGWFKIEYKEGRQGWISNQYAKKLNSELTPTPTPNITPTATPKASSSVTPKPTKTPSPTP